MVKDKAKGMLISVDIRQQVELLTDEEAGVLIKALLAYADEGTPFGTDNRVLAVVFAGVRAQLDTAAKRYASKCEKNRATALERERRKREVQEHECAQTCTDVHEREQTCTNSTNKIKENISNKKSTLTGTQKSSADGAIAPHSAPVDTDAFVRYFNAQLQAQGAIIKQVRNTTAQRKSAIEARARENGKKALQTVADKAAVSDFLNGKNDRGWLATFDWIMKPNNFAKVLEGNFDNNATATKGGDKNVNDLWQ
jgi:hypothetical protein